MEENGEERDQDEQWKHLSVSVCDDECLTGVLSEQSGD